MPEQFLPDPVMPRPARSMKERMLAGEPYLAADDELGELGVRAQDLADDYNATRTRDGASRRRILTELLGSVGEGVEIRPTLRVDYGFNIHIGARTFANWGLVAADVATITIGDNVWLGGGVIVLPGVTIGDNTVVGAGSVVVRDLPANVLAVGNPASVIRTI